MQKRIKVVGRLCRICSTAATWCPTCTATATATVTVTATCTATATATTTCTATWRPACLQIWPALHLNIALCARTFPCLHAHWRKAWGRKPLQSEAVQCKAKAPPTKADEIFPEFVEISSRQNLHSFPALGKLIILAGGSCSCKRHKDETIYQKVMTLLGCKKTGENFLYLCTRSL